MFSLPRISPVALFLVASVAFTAAQTTEKSAALTEQERKERARRVAARALLISLSTDARAFNDQTLRARSLARIADALWAVDAEQGRLMFRSSRRRTKASTGDRTTESQDGRWLRHFVAAEFAPRGFTACRATRSRVGRRVSRKTESPETRSR
jgi:hypothetical protein